MLSERHIRSRFIELHVKNVRNIIFSCINNIILKSGIDLIISKRCRDKAKRSPDLHDVFRTLYTDLYAFEIVHAFKRFCREHAADAAHIIGKHMECTVIVYELCEISADIIALLRLLPLVYVLVNKRQRKEIYLRNRV